MSLTPEQTTTMMNRLKSAEDSYHDLMIGNAARVFVDQNGERVEYAAQNASRLNAYILSLKIALGLDTGIAGPLRTRVF